MCVAERKMTVSITPVAGVRTLLRMSKQVPKPLGSWATMPLPVPNSLRRRLDSWVWILHREARQEAKGNQDLVGDSREDPGQPLLSPPSLG